jgi:hypothetical protein
MFKVQVRLLSLICDVQSINFAVEDHNSIQAANFVNLKES